MRHFDITVSALKICFFMLSNNVCPTIRLLIEVMVLPSTNDRQVKVSRYSKLDKVVKIWKLGQT